jgi:hypothetical protein
MKNENEIEIAWNMWNLIEKLSDLLWDRYDNEFIERSLKIEEQKYWESQSDKYFLSDTE